MADKIAENAAEAEEQSSETASALKQAQERGLMCLNDVRDNLNSNSVVDKAAESLMSLTQDKASQAMHDAEEISEKIKSDPNATQTAFAAINKILGDQTVEDKRTTIGEAQEGIDDTALQLFANIAKGLDGLENAEEKSAATAKLQKSFEFLGSGDSRDLDQSADLISEAIAGFLSSDPKPSKDVQNIVESCFKKVAEDVKDALPLSPQESEFKLSVTSSQESEEELKKKKAAEVGADSSEVDDKTEIAESKEGSGLSYEEAQEILGKMIKPTTKLGFALIIAIMIPGVGPVLAIGFLVATSTKDEDKSKKMEAEKLAGQQSEKQEYDERNKKIAEAINESENPTKTENPTAIGKQAHLVEVSTLDELSTVESTLKVSEKALENNGVAPEESNLPVPPASQNKQVKAKSSLEKEVADAASGLKSESLVGGTENVNPQDPLTPSSTASAKSNNVAQMQIEI